MAQKALKTLARSNTAILNRTHLITAILHALFLLLRLLLLRRAFTRTSLTLYLALSAPALALEFWFERIGRPRYSGPDLRTAGEDLEAKGLTEWMWDVVYWTWGCLVAAALLGDRLWWLYVAVPGYSAWLAWSTYAGMRAGLGGATEGNGAAQGTSKRAAKREKKGGQKTVYR